MQAVISHRFLGSFLLFAALLGGPAAAQSDNPADFFEMKVRPLFAENCLACHAETKMGGLTMTSRQALLEGGNSGPALVPGDPEGSLLIQAVRHTDERLKMPPTGKLEAPAIEILAAWISDGAVWPDSPAAPETGQSAEEFNIRPEHRKFWAFQPVRKPETPAVKDKSWPRSPIDHFVLAQLEAKGLKPVGPADRRTLLRRAYFDLIGLPPTPEEIDQFLRDDSPDAFARVVDELLKSPRYGERWGRYWLDVARYSDDKLNSTQMEPYAHAYYYRDWVIQAFNDDMPYDLFLKAQIAGDLLEGVDNKDLVAGLGFYALSPQFQDDRIDATTRGFQALTVACAQCHDHKFDPIPTEDYYALLGIFNNTKIDEFPLADQQAVEQYKRAKENVDAEQAIVDKFLSTQTLQLTDVLAAQTESYILAAWQVLGPASAPVEKAADQAALDRETLERWVKYLSNSPREHPLLDDWDLLVKGNPGEAEVRREAEKIEDLLVSVIHEKNKIDEENRIRIGVDDMVRKLNEVELLSLERDRYFLWRDVASNEPFTLPVKFETGILYYGGEQIDRFLTGVWREHVRSLRQKVQTLQDAMPPKYDFLHVIHDVEKPKNEHVHIRGSKDNLGDEVPRRYLTILSDDKSFTEGSGRLQLAEAIANPTNPLTARVMANRVWLGHFGQGIVGTPSNFGQMGERPSHPHLLDYLAAGFVEAGWSVKKLHREIMLSATYALSVEHSAKNHELDPDNRLFWRANRRRLDAETLRDSMLYLSGNLDTRAGGEPMELTAEENRRRTVYGYVSRRKLDKMLGLFDFPNPNQTSPRRIGTNTPLQGLFLLNSEFVMQQAERLTDRLANETGTDEKARIEAAYRLLYGRDPTGEEIRAGTRFVSRAENLWPHYAQVLLTANEFLYVQ